LLHGGGGVTNSSSRGCRLIGGVGSEENAEYVYKTIKGKAGAANLEPCVEGAVGRGVCAGLLNSKHGIGYSAVAVLGRAECRLAWTVYGGTDPDAGRQSLLLQRP